VVHEATPLIPQEFDEEDKAPELQSSSDSRECASEPEPTAKAASPQDDSCQAPEAVVQPPDRPPRLHPPLSVEGGNDSDNHAANYKPVTMEPARPRMTVRKLTMVMPDDECRSDHIEPPTDQLADFTAVPEASGTMDDVGASARCMQEALCLGTAEMAPTAQESMKISFDAEHAQSDIRKRQRRSRPPRLRDRGGVG
jgi:hypothetical protein